MAKQTLEKSLFKAADKLRKNIDTAEYKNVVLGLIFLKFISDSFTFQSVDVHCPSAIDIKEFNNRVSLIFNKMLANMKQIQHLEKTRDTLLPKLLNGSVRVQGFGE